MVLSCARGGSGQILGKSIFRRSGQTLAQLPREGMVTVPAGAQKLWRCGSEEHG